MAALGRVASDYVSHGCVTQGAALVFCALFTLLPVPIFVVSLAARLIGSDVAGPEARLDREEGGLPWPQALKALVGGAC